MEKKLQNVQKLETQASKQEKFRPLEIIALKEAEIKERIDNLLSYTVEEIQNIDNLMEVVTELDDLRDLGKISEYITKFQVFKNLYKKLNQREKKHFTEIYKGLVFLYYYERIRINIKEKHSSSLGNITQYLNEFKAENFEDKDIDTFLSFFDKDEKEFLLENFGTKKIND